MPKQFKRGLMWFRRDLRAHDNAALYHALKSCDQVFCFFAFDRDILDSLPRADRRVEFIRESLVDLDGQLRQLSSLNGTGGLIVVHAVASDATARMAAQLQADAVFANHDYEPQALARDARVQALLEAGGTAFHTFKDHVIFERGEVLTLAARPYSVFTPYKNAWLKKANDFYLQPYPVEKHAAALAAFPPDLKPGIPDLQELGFEATNLQSLNIPSGSAGGDELLNDFSARMSEYGNTRNFPSVKGPSYLSVHLRFGTVSIRKLAGLALDRQKHGSEGAAVWLSELIWRDFYAQILANFPHVATSAFKPEYNRIAWEQGDTAQALFDAWCKGLTGYPWWWPVF